MTATGTFRAGHGTSLQSGGRVLECRRSFLRGAGSMRAVVTVFVAVLLASPAIGAVPVLMNYQCVIVTEGGAPLGTVAFAVEAARAVAAPAQEAR